MRAGFLFPLVCLAVVALSEELGRPSLPPARVEREIDDPKLKAAIDDCIRRGVNWLKARQEPSGAWPELDQVPLSYPGITVKPDQYKPDLTALALLALLKCGVPPSDPCVTRGFDWLGKQGGFISGPYGCATTLMALEAKRAPKGASKVPSVQPNASDMPWAAKLCGQILGFQSESGGWRYGTFTPTDMEGGKAGQADVSCTQYALMGLKTARGMGIPVKPEAFSRAADFLMAQQETDGKTVCRITCRAVGGARAPDVKGYEDKVRGWPYMKGAASAAEAQASGAMTCAGLVGMLVCRSEFLEDKSDKKGDRAKRLARMEQSIFDGLAWLDENWSVSSNPPRSNFELGYHLYGLERVGVMADLRRIGPGHDWYLEGAGFLTERMTAEGDDKGFWAIGACRAKPETQETPYALLFLRKAAVHVGYPVGEAD